MGTLAVPVAMAAVSCSLATGLPAHADNVAPDISDDLSTAAPDAASAVATDLTGPTAAPASAPGSSLVYLDVKVEGKPAGRIVVELFPDAVPVGSQRFADLTVGKQGVGYRLSRFDGVFPTYVRNEGVKSLSYSADAVSPIAGGDSTYALEQEMAAAGARRHDGPGLVSLAVKEAVERPVQERLVAKNGKLVTVLSVAGEAPNGTGFVITTAAVPQLDATNLVVGRVVEGMDVVATIQALPYAKPRDEYYNKPFFEAGKLIGDKRAVVAEKGFNRPLKRVLVSAGGLVQ